jgi:hypothetical protein
MEIESLYDDEDHRELKSLKTPGLQKGLDRHCLAINLADSLDDLRKVRLAAAYVWLNSLEFAPENFGHDYSRIQGILGRAAGRRMMELLSKPKSEGSGGEKGGVTA